MEKSVSSSFLYRFEARLTPSPIGLVPEGLRIALGFEGTITDGMLKGARVWGIDQLLIVADGVGVIDAPKTISLGNLHVYEHLHGYCTPPPGIDLPPLEALLAPGFEWPDVAFTVRGVSTFRAATKELAHLNSALALVEGKASFATGRLVVETRLLAPG